MRQDEQIHDRDGAGCRLSPVVVLFHSKQHARIRAGRAEPAAFGLVPEALVLPALQVDGPLEPRGVGVRLKELEQAEYEIGVVFGVRRDLGVAVTVSTKENAGRRIPQAIPDERSCATRGVDVRGTRFRGRAERGQHAPGPRERGDHQAIP